MTINFERFIWRINSHCTFFAKITVSSVQCPLISPCITTLLATLRTPCRWWNFYFFVKIKILSFYRKVSFTILAVFGFAFHKFLYLPIRTNETITKLPADNTSHSKLFPDDLGHMM